ncbi:MAG TPA: hypothetical protein VGO83_14900 [Thermoleophilaceae bacterium]|nr:hypothetical protein [Thermoleophilaceae bacterium]
MGRLLKADFWKGANGVVATVAAIVGLAVTFGIIHPIGQGTEDALASAAGATVDAGSSRVTIEMSIDAGSEGKLAFSGDGAFDYRTNKGRLTYDYSATRGAEALSAIPAIIHPGALYYNFSSVAPKLSKPWVRMTPADLAKSLGASKQDVSDALSASGDPSQVLDYVKSAGDVEEVGEEQLFGVTTKHYKGELDPKKLDLEPGSTKGPIRIAVWVDDSGVVRRTEMSARFTDGGTTAALRIKQDLSDFGTKVRAEAPPADQVATLAEFQREAQAAGP